MSLKLLQGSALKYVINLSLSSNYSNYRLILLVLTPLHCQYHHLFDLLSRLEASVEEFSSQN